MPDKRIISKSKIFLLSAFFFLLSIFLYEPINLPQNLVLGFFFFSIFTYLFLLFFEKDKFISFIQIFLIFLFAFTLGFLLRKRVDKKIDNSLFRKKSGEKVEFIGIVRNTEKEVNKIKLTVNILKREEEGKVLITKNRFPDYNYGDKIKIKGEIQKPPVFDDFNYRKFLEQKGVYAVMYYPKVELKEKNRGNYFYGQILKLKEKFREVIYTNLSPPHSTILRAMLLGDKDRIEGELGKKLNFAGVRHITAISGMHILILVLIISRFLKSKKNEFLILLLFLIFFLTLIGFPASAVRASVMILLIKIASLFGRMKAPLHSLLIAALFMNIFNPLLLKYNLGFQLSFLAVIGITYFSPFLFKKLEFIPNFFEVREILTITLAAQVFVFPLLLFKMGSASVISPLANILIVPLLSFILGFGFLFVLGGSLLPFLGKVLSLFVFILVDYVMKVVNFCSQFEVFVIEYKLPLFFLIFIYSLLIYLIFKINKREPLAFYPY